LAAAVSFDPIYVYPPIWSTAVFIGIMWGLPTLVCVIRRQSESAVRKRQLLFVISILALGAMTYTLATLHVFEPTGELLELGLLSFGVSLVLAPLAFLLLRLVDRRRDQA
jgi:hypothetical protein